MVLRKRQEYGSNPFNAPFVPRAPRSVRRRVLHKKKSEDNQICAFELLASLAGKLLQESESCSASSIASRTNDELAINYDVFKPDQGEDILLKTECVGQGRYEENVILPEFTSANDDQKRLLKECSHVDDDSIVEHSSVITNSSSSEKAINEVKSVIPQSKTSCSNFPCKFEGVSPVSKENGYVENVFSRQQDVNGVETGDLTIDNTYSSKDPLELCVKFPALVNTDNNVKLGSCSDPVSNASILRLRNDFRLGLRDDDDKFSRCNKPGTKPRAFRHPSRFGGRRIKKLLTSKYWKVAPKLKDYGLSKVDFLDGGIKPIYHKRKICYSGGRYQHETSYKRRKVSDHSLAMTSDGGFSSESVCNSPEKENGVSTSAIRHQASFNSKDSHVRFSIKSFRIPELFIEVPETATVGSLKRTVMETLTAILGGGLRVGLVLHGEKVWDNNTTLQQTGITSKENLDSLGFTLEPSRPGQPPQTVCTEGLPVPLSCDTSLVSRSQVAPVLDSNPPPLTNPSNNFDCNHESASSYTDKLTGKTLLDSRALVTVPPVRADALAVVPVNQKSRRSEIVQRRARRPFSVSEVEALVQAVEELGTGRWRDVKLRSFENADHRTYVDLKDKWKTLVHTAKIAPQQRRGEPVPQQLLDRVLAAHAYWSQHQAKNHTKSQGQAVALNITDGNCGRNGVEAITM